MSTKKWGPEDWLPHIALWRTKLKITPDQYRDATALALIFNEASPKWDPNSGSGLGGAKNPGLLQHTRASLRTASVRLVRLMGKGAYDAEFGKSGKVTDRGPGVGNITKKDTNGALYPDLDGQARAGSISIAATFAIAATTVSSPGGGHDWVPYKLALKHHAPGAVTDINKIERKLGSASAALLFYTKLEQGDFIRTKNAKGKKRQAFNPATEGGAAGIRLMGKNFLMLGSPRTPLYVRRFLKDFERFSRGRFNLSDVEVQEQLGLSKGSAPYGPNLPPDMEEALSKALFSKGPRPPQKGVEAGDVIFSSGEVRGGDQFSLAYYLTPEELRKGIISQIYHITDWHLLHLAGESDGDGDKSEESVSTRREPITADKFTTPGDNAENKARETDDSFVGPVQADFTRDLSRSFVSNINLDQRTRYIISLVDAEFYRRRYASRSVPAVPGPFNPFPVAGFSGLLLNPDRPIVGYISSVSHTINVQSATGASTVSMTAPRYWDEGEVWFWFGGWNLDARRVGAESEFVPGVVKDNDYTLYRRFPQWHSANVVASNNFNTQNDYRSGENRQETDIDRFYQFLLGCNSIDYMSNHYDRVKNADRLRSLIVDKETGGQTTTKKGRVEDKEPAFEVSPCTLAPVEKNRLIAELDSEGKFAPWTLAHRFWGHIEPQDAAEAEASVEQSIEYNKRFGVREKELLVDFLKNKFKRTKKMPRRAMYVGPTFGNVKSKSGNLIPNPQQKLLIRYMEDIERRKVGGGI
jgi:hypothetical protein